MSVQIKKTFQSACNTSIRQSGNASNEFANSDQTEVIRTESSIFTPYAFIENQELPNFPGGVGDVQNGTRDTISDADYILQYEPPLDYVNTQAQVDIHINYCLTLIDTSIDIRSLTPTGKIYVYLYKGIDYPTAHTAGPVNTTPFIFTGNDCATPITNRAFTPAEDSLGNVVNSIVFDHETKSFDYHGTLTFARGEKLFLLFYLDSEFGVLFGLNFYSGEYNSRFSPAAVDGFTSYPLMSGYMGSATYESVAQSFTRTLDATFLGKFLSVFSANLSTSNTKFTVSSFGPATGDYFFCFQDGYTPVQILAGSGVTIIDDPTYGNTTSNVGCLMVVMCTGANTWTLTIYPNGFIPAKQFAISADQSYARITLLSQVQLTDPSTVYMVNESLSRLAENVTNGNLRVKSSYFGRKDSLPYMSTSDGVGSLECITNGLLIRNWSPIKALYWGNFATPITVESGTSYTPALVDLTGSPPNAFYQFTNSGAIIFTIPVNANVAFDVGAQFLIQQTGAGVITIFPQSAMSEVVTIDCPNNNLKSSGLNSYLMLTKVAENDWLMVTHAPMFASYQSLFADLHAIHNIGMGIEPDADRPGFDRLRVERWDYFYNDTVLMTCLNVDEVTLDSDYSNLFSRIETGYDKWEAEGTNGLDDPHSDRQYRTGIKAMDIIFTKKSKMVASCYAIEQTRRINLMNNTSDWRYDKDLFIICLIRDTGTASAYSTISGGSVTGIGWTDGAPFKAIPTVIITGGGSSGATAYCTGLDASGNMNTIVIDNPGTGYTSTPTVTIIPGMIVDQGNITNPQNLIDPATFYNWAITPLRNGLRWAAFVLQTLINPSTSQLLFNSGHGNIFAYGEQSDSPFESGPLSENANIALADISDTSIVPLYKPQLVKFKYPMSYDQWTTVFTNPYGLIGYSVNGGSTQYGWIQDLKYSPFDGIAEFTLKPKIS